MIWVTKLVLMKMVQVKKRTKKETAKAWSAPPVSQEETRRRIMTRQENREFQGDH